MSAPTLEIKHIKTSKQYVCSTLMYRYWFEWFNRKKLGSVTLQLELFDADGKKVTEARIKLPKVKITGHLEAVIGGSLRPMYNSPVKFKLDDIVLDKRPVSFHYYTIGLFSKSDVIKGVMTDNFEDISRNG